MDKSTVIQQLQDLPRAFKREGPQYNAFINSFAVSLFSATEYNEELSKQLNLDTTFGNWLDVWGALFGMKRYTAERDTSYQTRIKKTLTGWASTIAGIGDFIKQVYDLDVTIVEDFYNSSYQIQLSKQISTTELTNIAMALTAIRPAGIPFLPFVIASSGPYVNTSGFVGMSQMAGSYVAGSFNPLISSNTPSVISQLPVDLLSFNGMTSSA